MHILIWLDGDSKKKLNANVDAFVSAKILDPETDRIGYNAVARHMMHGPCGLENPKSPCMKNMKCTKHFPKQLVSPSYFTNASILFNSILFLICLILMESCHCILFNAGTLPRQSLTNLASLFTSAETLELQLKKGSRCLTTNMSCLTTVIYWLNISAT